MRFIILIPLFFLFIYPIFCSDVDIYRSLICGSFKIKNVAVACISRYWTQKEAVHIGLYLNCLGMESFDELLELECKENVSSDMFKKILTCKPTSNPINIIKNPEPNILEITQCLAANLAHAYETD
ncbi:uncharacterized protein [Centruroides vittatus]|uniref:uncharacterized protein n=1 Tax=Centruroides vittatus TaxID=120091 RepID=UPI00350EE2F0